MGFTWTNEATTEFELLEDGVYNAVFDSYEEVDYGNGPAFKMSFMLTDPDFAGTTQTALAGVPKDRLHTGCKLGEWVQALLGRPISEGEDIEIVDLKGKPCRLFITTVTRKKKNGEEGQFNHIDKVMPIVKKNGKKPAPQQPAEEKEDDLPF